MRKLFASLLVAVLMCMMLVPAATAEGSISAEDILPELVGEWKSVMMMDMESEMMMETSNIVRINIVINEDGSVQASLKESLFANDYTADCVIGAVDDLGTMYGVNLVNASTGELELYVLYLPEDESLGSMMLDTYLIMLRKDYIPAAELAPVVPFMACEEIYGDWMIESASIDGREVDLTSMYIPFYYLQLMPCSFEEFHIYDSQGEEICNTSECYLPDDNEGAIRYEFYDEVGEQKYYDFYKHEDGSISGDFDGLVVKFVEYTIDPLYEYTDTETVQMVQEMLNAYGYECGTPDGIAGNKTATALSAYQTDNGLTVTGTITHETLTALQGN